LTEDEQLIDRINNAAGLILGVSENRTWIEMFLKLRAGICYSRLS
jgi:hypothetical protein